MGLKAHAKMNRHGWWVDGGDLAEGKRLQRIHKVVQKLWEVSNEILPPFTQNATGGQPTHLSTCGGTPPQKVNKYVYTNQHTNSAFIPLPWKDCKGGTIIVGRNQYGYIPCLLGIHSGEKSIWLQNPSVLFCA